MNKDCANMIRLYEDTRAPMLVCQRLLEAHSYDTAKQLILGCYEEIADRGARSYSEHELEILPEWKSTVIKGKIQV